MPFETTLPLQISYLVLKIPVTGSDPSKGVPWLELVAELQMLLISRTPYHNFL